MAASPSIASLFAQRVTVGVGDLGVSNNVNFTLSTYALGSCVAVVAYDPVAHAAGLLHMMLPDSSISPEKAANQPAMFANTGLPLLFKSIAGFGVDRARVRLFMAGGANVMQDSSIFKIGERNVQTTQAWLSRNNFVVARSAIGGTINRSVHLEIGTGSILLKTPIGNETFSLKA